MFKRSLPERFAMVFIPVALLCMAVGMSVLPQQAVPAAPDAIAAKMPADASGDIALGHAVSAVTKRRMFWVAWGPERSRWFDTLNHEEKTHACLRFAQKDFWVQQCEMLP